MELSKTVSNWLAQQINSYRCQAIFDYGSTVYGNKVPSDQDLIVVIENNPTRDGGEFYEQYKYLNFDITVMSEGMFFHQLDRHEITQIECVNLPEKHVHFIDHQFKAKLAKFEVDNVKLRHALSQKASNSYVKAKKKLIVEDDFDLEVSVKSLFHSLRILQIGTQLATTGKIQNFAETNALYPKIIESYRDSHLDWVEIDNEFKPMYNELATEFKKHAPKK